jgi:hypothetical protein
MSNFVRKFLAEVLEHSVAFLEYETEKSPTPETIVKLVEKGSLDGSTDLPLHIIIEEEPYMNRYRGIWGRKFRLSESGHARMAVTRALEDENGSVG